MLKDRTPASMRCGIGHCPGVYQECDVVASCPGVYENEAGDYVIVGKRPTQETLDELQEKIGEDEWAVMVPDEMRDLVEQFVNEGTTEGDE